MPPNRETRLCSYRYDPLDRLVDCTPSAQSPTRRFYLKDRLATEIQDAVQRSVMQHEDQLLAQQQRQSGAVAAHLLATDQQRSVLNVLDVVRPHPLAYSPYGHRPAGNGLLSLLGFNGERRDPVTGCYLLGNGYRAFNPVMMRFTIPDSWSPFGEGGLNAYGYCAGDPVNRNDPSGHAFNLFSIHKLKFWKSARTIKKSRNTPATVDSLVGTYKKTERITAVRRSPAHLRLDKQRTSKSINDLFDDTSSTTLHTSSATDQADASFKSAVQELITSEQRAIKQLISSNTASKNVNQSELNLIAIGVIDQRILKLEHTLRTTPRPQISAQTRDIIRNEKG
ncbi:RHS repeat-associated core domain-containing protein [Pseudomonas jessenii]|uniref:RHS repeat-associated core domain-containing protein n=1 Tax=Pseudomonas jessenii TaxID=77298 RepID=UPI003891C443